MKAYFIALIVIVIAGFSFIGLIIFRGFGLPGESKTVVFLNTRRVIEADYNAGDATMGPGVIAVYLAGKEKGPYNAIPLADVFVCVSSNKSDSTKTDTVLLLDTQLLNPQEKLGDVTKFWTGVTPAEKLNGCRMLIPENWAKKFKAYKYMYARVKLITDD